MARRQRDYAAEYQRRVRNAMARGFSRRQARGHPGRAEPTITEEEKGRLRVQTLEGLREWNLRLRREPAFARTLQRMAIEVLTSKEGRPYTKGRVPEAILFELSHRQLDYIFGY